MFLPNRSRPRADEAGVPVSPTTAPLATPEPFASAFCAAAFVALPVPPVLPDVPVLPVVPVFAVDPLFAALLLPGVLALPGAGCPADPPAVALPTTGRLRNRMCCCPKVHTFVVSQ